MRFFTHCLLFLSLVCLFATCSKKTSVDPGSSQPGNKTKSLTTFKYTGTNSNVALGSFNYKEQKLLINFYGDTDAKGETKKIRTLTMQKVNSDTVFNFVFNENDQIKALFLTVKGKEINEVLQFTHQDSLITIRNHVVDPVSFNAQLKEHVSVKKMDFFPFNYKKNGRVSASISPKYLALAIVAAVGVLVAIQAAALIYTTGITLVAVVQLGVSLGLVSSAFKEGLRPGEKAWDKIKEKFELPFEKLFSSEESEEVEAPPSTLTINPSKFYDKIKQANLNNKSFAWCTCSFSYALRGGNGGGLSVSDPGHSENAIANLIYSYTDIILCNGGKTSYASSATFNLKPGYTATALGITYNNRIVDYRTDRAGQVCNEEEGGSSELAYCPCPLD